MFHRSCGTHRACLQTTDVKDVGYVIVSVSFSLYSLLNLIYILLYQNYDFPNNCEDYIHRIGRTGVCSFCISIKLYLTDLRD